jgi:hypothetical protein
VHVVATTAVPSVTASTTAVARRWCTAHIAQYVKEEEKEEKGQHAASRGHRAISKSCSLPTSASFHRSIAFDW